MGVEPERHGTCDVCGLDLDEAVFEVDPRYCSVCDPRDSLFFDDNPTFVDDDVEDLSGGQRESLEPYLRAGLTSDQAVVWLGVEPSEAVSWIRIGYGPEDREHWETFSAEQVGFLVELGCGGPDDALRLSAGVHTLIEQDLQAWHVWGLSPPELADLADRLWDPTEGLPDPPDDKWRTLLDVELAEALAWERYGFNPSTAKPWSSLFASPEEAARLEQHGVSVARARQWSDFYIEPAELLIAADAGAADRLIQASPIEMKKAGAEMTLEGVIRWAGLTASQIFKAVDSGFQDTESFLEYGSLGLTGDELELYRNEGLTVRDDIVATHLERTFDVDPDKARKYLDSGVAPSQVRAWIEDGTPPDLAADWSRAGYKPEEARLWGTLGVQRPDHIRRITSERLKLSELRAWSQLDVASTTAQAWMREGMSPDGYVQWTQIGVHDAKTARQWTSVGIGPSDALGWIDAGSSAAAAAQWSSSGVDADTAKRRRAAGLKPPPPGRG